MKKLAVLSICGFLLAGIESTSLANSLPTAFQAKAAASEVVKKDARDNLIEIYSPHSSIESTNRWRVSFWDPTLQKVIIVLVEDGHAVDISDNYEGYFLDHFSQTEFSEQDVIDPLYLEIDSDKALELAMEDEELRSLPIDGVEYRLIKDHPSVLPIWNITFYTNESGTDLQSAQVNISADSGEILDVHIYTASISTTRHQMQTWNKYSSKHP